MDFSHLKKLEIKGRTAKFHLDDLEDVISDAVLILKPATQANPNYFNEVLDRSGNKLRKLKKGKIDQKTFIENRKEDLELFPLHVIVGWENVRDGNGKEVPFSTKNCILFLEFLPDWIFDKIRDFAATNENFVQSGINTPENIEEISKN